MQHLFLSVPVEVKNLSSKCDSRLVRYQPAKLVFLNDYLLDDNHHTLIISKCRSVILLFMRFFQVNFKLTKPTPPCFIQCENIRDITDVPYFF